MIIVVLSGRRRDAIDFKEAIMRIRSGMVLAISLSCLAWIGPRAEARAQTIIGSPSLALRGGETTELTDLYWISSNCKSQLKGTPAVEVIDGPPGVIVTVKEAMVVPRNQGCAKPVAGGKVMIAAKDIEDASYTRLTIRVTYKTRDGERQRSAVFNLSLFP
jgi:hypothetical protein